MTSGQSEAAEMIETSGNPWGAAVDWPDKVGLWAALAGDVVLPVWAASGMKQAIVTDTLGVHLLRDDGYKFLPLKLTLPPPPPKPSKWDYVPKAGDIVYWRARLDTTTIHGPCEIIGTPEEITRNLDFRQYALATVSPAPGVDE